MSPNFLEQIIWLLEFVEKSVFRVWQLRTLVPIKMLVSSLTELHTPCQTLSFSPVSKEQPFFKSVITAQTVTLGAHLLVKAQTIPQNAHQELFI